MATFTIDLNSGVTSYKPTFSVSWSAANSGGQAGLASLGIWFGTTTVPPSSTTSPNWVQFSGNVSIPAGSTGTSLSFSGYQDNTARSAPGTYSYYIGIVDVNGNVVGEQEIFVDLVTAASLTAVGNPTIGATELIPWAQIVPDETFTVSVR